MKEAFPNIWENIASWTKVVFCNILFMNHNKWFGKLDEGCFLQYFIYESE